MSSAFPSSSSRPPLGIERCDPGGMLRRALGGEPPACDVHDLVLLWLLRLPGEIDPAAAAGCVLAAAPRPEVGGAADLRALLGEIADWPRERLSRRKPTATPH